MNQIFVEQIKTDLNAFQIYKLFMNEPYSFILDSAMTCPNLGRYSILGFNPFLRIESKGNIISVWQKGEEERSFNDNPFSVLDAYLKRYRVHNKSSLPFIGGAVGYFSYDLCHHIEKLPRSAEDDINTKDMSIGFYDSAIIIDNIENKTFAVCCAITEAKETNKSNEAQENAKKRLISIKEMIEKYRINEINTSIDTTNLDIGYRNNKVTLTSNFTKDDYNKAILKAKEYIRDGDIFQMNMTQRFTTLINKHPINIYERLRKVNAAPFSAYIDLGEVKILSSSPERFIKIRGDKIETRPIKGTIARGPDVESDNENKKTIFNSEKDRAENVMIVDLMRNDLGRICKFGSVKVPELYKVESYSTVHHLVSTVTGTLKDGCGTEDVFNATFPGGSITGAPKIRSMEIIDELEPTCRGLYTGSIGYIGFDGNVDLNIVIRTILVKGDRAYYQVGGGIVADSIPENEYAETLCKGEALQKALLGGE